jgi:hypothetical protein
LRSPPLKLRARNISPAVARDEGTGAKGALQLPQNWLFARLIWPHATHTIPSGFPQASQNPLVALLSLLQYRQSIREPFSP